MNVINADVVVIGAGPAGVCAAVASARMGVSTVLAGNRTVLGGNSSSDIRVWTRGATGGGNLFAEEMGVWGDFKMRNLYTNAEGNPIFWSDVLLDLCLQEPNLTLLTDLHIMRVEKDNERITAVGGWQLSSEREYRLEGKMFIDCTGDGSIGSMAGAAFQTDKEARGQYGESLAAEQPEAATQGHSLLYYVKKCERKVKFIPPSYAYDVESVKKLAGSGRVIKEHYSGSDYWWFEYGGDRNVIDEAQDIALELRRLVMGVWNYIKNSGEFDADCYTLEWVGSYSGKRESRRMITDYVLNQNDLLECRAFYDGAFYGGWFIDFHPPGGFESQNDSCEQIAVNLYEIPLRCLYNSRLPNLLFAGRNIGASHVAFASSRIMNTCALSGQAAGTAAAWCVQNGAPVGKLDAGLIRRLLQREDMLLPGYRNDDPEDLARDAICEAGSYFDGACKNASGSMPIGDGCFITFPAPRPWGVRLLVNANTNTVLRGIYHLSELPSRYRPGREVGNVQIPVAEGESWITLPAPVEAKGFVTLTIDKNPQAFIRTESRQRTGILCGHANCAEYFYPCIAADYRKLYSPDNVINGYHRPWSQPNLWVAGDEPEPWLQLSWASPRELEEVRLYMNPDLCKEIPSSRTERWSEDHRFAARAGMPSELVRSFRIEARVGDEWSVVAREPQNWRRMAVVSLTQPVKADALRVVFEENYENGVPQLFEIRVYRRKSRR